MSVGDIPCSDTPMSIMTLSSESSARTAPPFYGPSHNVISSPIEPWFLRGVYYEEGGISDGWLAINHFISPFIFNEITMIIPYMYGYMMLYGYIFP